jgi:phosphohistidine phosphatase SixA
MQLTLVRHGKAVDREDWHGEDDRRPLTREGIEQALRIFELVEPWISADEVWTSPWLRARHTAELACSAWQLPLREMPWLAGEALGAGERVRHLPRRTDVVLVGHEPDLGALAGLVTGGNPLPLKKAGMVILEGDPEPAGMTVLALLSPKVVLGLAGKR